ncbi:MAG: OmpP1/FadL family transporter [Oligoflexus sp.]
MMLKQSKQTLSYGMLAGFAYLLSSSSAYAAGFALRNQSASGTGVALSSDTVNISDASGMFSNPAVMSEFEGHHLSLNLNYTAANISAKDATLSSTELGGPHPVQGSAAVDDVSEPIIIPSLFGVHQINEDIHVGWSVAIPWATNTEYSQDWAGRYHGINTELVTTELTINGSYRINEMFNVGLGINIQQATGKFNSAVDLGLIGFSQGATGQETIGRLDAISEFEGDSIAYGFQFGVFAKPRENLRVGFNYRSEVVHEAEGDMTFTGTNAQASQLLAGFAQDARFRNSTDAKLKLTLPAVYSLGVAYDLDAFTVYGNLTHTGWSSFSEFTPEYNGARSRTLLDWNDSLFVAVGGEYRLDDALTLRVGLAQDQGVTEDRKRTPRTPDNDRLIAAIGAGYKLNEMISFNAAYQKLFIEETTIELSDQDYPDAQTRGNLSAKLEIDPHIFVVSADLAF